MRTAKLCLLSPNNMRNHRIEGTDLSLEQCEVIKGIVCNNYTSSEDYKMTRGTGAFLQAYYPPDRIEPNRSFVQVEFWSQNMEAIERFIEYLNNKMNLT